MDASAIIQVMRGLETGLGELNKLVTPLMSEDTLPRSESAHQAVAGAIEAASDLISTLNDLEEYTFPYEDTDDFYGFLDPTEDDPC